MSLIHLCGMQHRGHIVKQVIQNNGYSLKWVADQMHKSQSTLSIQLGYEQLPWKYIHEIGNIIKYDFRKEFPEMPLLSSEGGYLAEEQRAEYITLQNRDSWRGQYHLLKEAYLDVLQKYTALLEEVSRNKDTNGQGNSSN